MCDCDPPVDEMKHSVSAYDKHVIICLPPPWPSDISDIPFVNKIKAGLSSSNMSIKLTACDYVDNSSDTTFRVIVYPDELLFRLTDGPQVDFFVNYVLGQNSASSIGAEGEKVPWEKLILVCTHAERDKRCGRAGPQIIELMNTALAGDTRIKICGSSHIGGHKYAGTLIVYPDCKWYGRMSKYSTDEFIEDVVKSLDISDQERRRILIRDALVEKCYRGKGYDW